MRYVLMVSIHGKNKAVTTEEAQRISKLILARLPLLKTEVQAIYFVADPHPKLPNKRELIVILKTELEIEEIESILRSLDGILFRGITIYPVLNTFYQETETKERS